MQSVWKRAAKIMFQSPGFYSGLGVFLAFSLINRNPVHDILISFAAMLVLFYSAFVIVILIFDYRKNQKPAK